MIKPKIIILHPFPFDLLVFYGKDKDLTRDWLKKELNSEDFDNVVGPFKKGKTVQSPDGWIFLWTEEKDVACLAHESFHVCEYLFSKVGINYNYDSGELWAYMIQYIINNVTKGKI